MKPSLVLLLVGCLIGLANSQCVYQRVYTVSPAGQAAIQQVTIDHDFGTSIELVVVPASTLSVSVVANVEDPIFLSPDYLDISSSETSNTSTITIRHNFQKNVSTTGNGNTVSEGRSLVPSLTFVFAAIGILFTRSKVFGAIALICLLSVVIAETGCRKLTITVQAPPTLMTLCENSNCQVVSAVMPPVYEQCKVSNFQFTPTTASVFADFTGAEYTEIRDFLLSKSELNLTPYPQATLGSNYIVSIENDMPTKDSALNYLDKSGAFPGRFAKAIVYRGAAVPPDVQEIIVPYPIDNTYRISTLYNNGSIPFLMRQPDTLEYGVIDSVITEKLQTVAALMNESFGTVYGGNCNSNGWCMTYSDTAPRGKDRTQRQTWFFFLFDIYGKYSHPIHFEILLEHKSTDPANWDIIGVNYNFNAFNTLDELNDAYNSGNITKYVNKGPTPDSYEQKRTGYYRIGEERPGERKAPPRHYEPEGKRYNITGNHVSWVGWSMEFGTRPTTGLQLYDIRFKGERIVYEVGVQDSIALYGGFRGIVQAITNYQDVAWGMGRSMYELKQGIDCPVTATFINVTYFRDDSVVTLRNAICIFERDDAQPIRRHYDYGDPYNFYGGIPSYSLVIRSCNAVYNYDYLYDYVFYLNGAIEVKVATSGYLQAAPWDLSELPYGAPVSDGVMGTLHDHIINYKLDMDVLGSKNKFQIIDITAETINLPYMPAIPWVQKRADRRYAKNETEAIYVYDPTRPMLMVVVGNQTNKYGTPRGYKVNINGMIHNLVGDAPVANSMKWSKYQMTVTQRKETEPTSALGYDQACVFEPLIDFDTFLNEENLLDEDLVLWPSIGVHHLPHSEDIPNTSTTGNSGSIWIKPYNYFDEDPTVDLYNQVMITPNPNGGNIVDNNGQNYNAICVPVEQEIVFDGGLIYA